MSAAGGVDSSPVIAYQAIRRKLLTIHRWKTTVDDDHESISGRSSKRRREFAPPEVIKRLKGNDNGTGKIAGGGIVHVGEDGKMAVFWVGFYSFRFLFLLKRRFGFTGFCRQRG